VAAAVVGLAGPRWPSPTTADIVPTKTKPKKKEGGTRHTHQKPTREGWRVWTRAANEATFGPLLPSLATEQADPCNHRESTAKNAGLGGACTHAPPPQWRVGRVGDFIGLGLADLQGEDVSSR